MGTTEQARRRPAADVDRWCQTFLDRCREKGLRATPQRLAIYRVLAEDPTHPTADSVHARVKPQMPSLSVATVYRILESFQREGLVRKVSTPDGAARFDANLQPHQHLVCRGCRSVVDLTSPTLARLELPARIPDGFLAEALDVRVVGLCTTCRA